MKCSRKKRKRHRRRAAAEAKRIAPWNEARAEAERLVIEAATERWGAGGDDALVRTDLRFMRLYRKWRKQTGDQRTEAIAAAVVRRAELSQDEYTARKGTEELIKLEGQDT